MQNFVEVADRRRLGDLPSRWISLYFDPSWVGRARYFQSDAVPCRPPLAIRPASDLSRSPVRVAA